MIDYGYVEKNRARLERSLRARGLQFDLHEIDRLGKERRTAQAKYDELRSQLNLLSQEIGTLFKAKSQESTRIEELKKKSAALKSQIQIQEEPLRNFDQELHERLLYLPNVLDESVVVGSDSSSNPVIRTWGEPKMPVAKPRSHEELGVALGILDLERASRVSGARFSYLVGLGARLERALLNFMIDLHRQHGYREIWPPALVSREAMIGTGQLPKFEDEAFKTMEPSFYLAPTAEVPVVNFHRGEILEGDDLPISYVAYSPCFRREAGSYGKDTKGLIRQHQFDKVELVKFTKPTDSYEALESLTRDAERVLQMLNLPYRVVSLCSGDIGFASSKTYDIEVWLPGQNAYREISSCSNCEDFQARRAEIKFRPAEGTKPMYVHTLNGSGLAIGRTWIALVENYQQQDGSVNIPDSLIPYFGAKTITKQAS